MGILTIDTSFENHTSSGDVEELGKRVELMHNAFASNPSVRAVDIFTEGTTDLHIFVSVVGEEDETREDVSARAEQIIMSAFEAAEMRAEALNVDAAQAETVREFAFA